MPVLKIPLNVLVGGSGKILYVFIGHIAVWCPCSMSIALIGLSLSEPHIDPDISYQIIVCMCAFVRQV